MDIKTEILALAIRQLAKRSKLIRKPTTLEALVTEILGVKSYDRQLAEDIIEESRRAAAAAKRAKTKREFNRIVKNY